MGVDWGGADEFQARLLHEVRRNTRCQTQHPLSLKVTALESGAGKVGIQAASQRSGWRSVVGSGHGRVPVIGGAQGLLHLHPPALHPLSRRWLGWEVGLITNRMFDIGKQPVCLYWLPGKKEADQFNRKHLSQNRLQLEKNLV